MRKKGWKEWGDAIIRISEIGSNPKYVTQAGNVALASAKMLCSGFIVSSGELRGSIGMTITRDSGGISAHVGTNKRYAAYVEFGTGPKGAADHDGTAPDVGVTYTMSPWWIHESQVDPNAAQVYGWFHIDTEAGRFYKVTGQPAHPYIYPAFHDNEETLRDILKGGFEEAIG